MDNNCNGSISIDFTRSFFDNGTKLRSPINILTAWLDCGMIYSSVPNIADSLRSKQGGKLSVSEGNLLPIVNETFVAGDLRNSENVALTTLHVVLLR
jgi:peroxidase